jgi:hypothetical protein|nr:MAG TPA: hypothetical protein [Caudoviricetes sp.]
MNHRGIKFEYKKFVGLKLENSYCSIVKASFAKNGITDHYLSHITLTNGNRKSPKLHGGFFVFIFNGIT